MIFNPPEHLHRITVGKHEPALLAYAWMGCAAHLEEYVMVLITNGAECARFDLSQRQTLLACGILSGPHNRSLPS